MRDAFRKLANVVSQWAGSPWAFISAIVILLIWILTGPLFNYSDTWQLIINTGTTIVTFLMVFLIQSTQNRDARAIHLKLDELIRAVHNARNEMIDVENVSEEELEEIHDEFRKVLENYQKKNKSKRNS